MSSTYPSSLLLESAKDLDIPAYDRTISGMRSDYDYAMYSKPGGTHIRINSLVTVWYV